MMGRAGANSNSGKIRKPVTAVYSQHFYERSVGNTMYSSSMKLPNTFNARGFATERRESK
jgi:hypothetical protein